MHFFTMILTNLRAAIAAKAARDRALSGVLVLVWGRVSRMAVRLERLFARWRAGTLPAARVASARVGRGAAPARKARVYFPSGAGWLFKLVWEAGAFGTQLAHVLEDKEFAAFVAAVPEAGRILRPLFRMLTVDPAPEPVRRRVAVLPVPVVPAVGTDFEGDFAEAKFLPV